MTVAKPKCGKLIRHQKYKYRARVAVAFEAGQASTDRSHSGAYSVTAELVVTISIEDILLTYAQRLRDRVVAATLRYEYSKTTNVDELGDSYHACHEQSTVDRRLMCLRLHFS